MCRDTQGPRIFLTTRFSEKNVQSGVPSTLNYIPRMLSLKGSNLGFEPQFFPLKNEITITFLSCVTQGAQLWDDLERWDRGGGKWRGYMYRYIANSLSCTAETNTGL